MSARQRAWIEPAEMRAAPHLTADQPGAFQHLDVFRDGCERHRKGFGELAHRPFPGGELAQHLPPRRIAERVEDGVHLDRLKVNHVVEYRRARAIVNLMV